MPDRIGRYRCREYWTYERAPPASGGLIVNFPVIGGGVSLSGAGDCRATFELVRGRVARVGYGGANDLSPACDTACAAVVQDCLQLLDEGAFTRMAEAETD